MNLIDNNGVTYLLQGKRDVDHEYYLAPDVVEEAELAEIEYARRMPRRIIQIANHPAFDEVVYLENYRRVLNQYGGRSFYSMKGFGDVSILASIHAIAAVAARQGRLFEADDPIVVYTDDAPLTGKILREFGGQGVVTVLPTAWIV